MGWNTADKPCASKGLDSYRYRGRYGWVMIGANSVSQAISEARRTDASYDDIAKLQWWNGTKYIPIVP